jgi:hypothetical protein
MAFTLQVQSRTVAGDGSVQYQFSDGTGLVFPSTDYESEWADETEIEAFMRIQTKRVLVAKTIAGGSNLNASYDIAIRNVLAVQ